MLAVALATASCSDSSATDDGLPPPISLDSTTSSSSTTTTTVTTSSSTTTTTTSGGKPLLDIPTEWESDLDEIFGRYLLYWDAFLIAMGPPEANPNYPPLRELAGDQLHAELAAEIAATRDAGEVFKDPTGSATDHGLRLPNPAVLTKTEGNEVTIQDCFINGWAIETLDGDIVDNAVAVDLLNVKMKVVDGEWRVLGVRDADDRTSGYQECKDVLDQ